MDDSFWFGFQINDFLFQGLCVNSISGFLTLCVSLTVVAVIFEGLKVLHTEAKLSSVLLSHQIKHEMYSSNDGALLMGNIPENVRIKRAISYMAEISIYTGQVILGYLIMLTVMTYNVYASFAEQSATWQR